MTGIFQRYLLPGFVFQGIVIGGGYATGRELAEFFMPGGPVGGLLGMMVAATIWGLVMAVSFELCRLAQAYDYRSFFRGLLGPFWFLYEILYFVLMVLILGVIGAATGEISRNLLGVSPLLGTVFLLAAVGVLTFFGSTLIERFMSVWSGLLYVTFLVLVIWCFVVFGDDIATNFSQSAAGTGWALDGLRYAGYNLAAVPAVFFCLRHIRARREALTAGALGGIIAMVPAVLLYVAMMAQYPAIATASIPSADLIAALDVAWFAIVFQVVLIGTFIQTGVGLVHAVNERVAASLEARARDLHPLMRPALACGLLGAALVLADRVGIIGLIASGYGLLTWGFIAVFIVPVLTIGAWRILRP
ncbi:MAG: hypothetical protein WEB93_06625 [Sphingomonadales bacterium]